MAIMADPAPASAAIRAEDLSLRRRVGALVFICLAYGFYAWAWNTVDILRPYIRADLGLTLAEAGSLYSAQAIGALIGAVVNGQLADKFGRRRALAVVMLGYGTCLVAGVFVASYPQVLLQRVVMGYFMGSMYPICVGIYVGLFPPTVRAKVASIILGVYNAAVSLLGIASAALFSAGRDWHLLLWVGLLPIVLAPLAFLLVPDDRLTIPWGGSPADSGVGGTPAPTAATGKLPISELFSGPFRRRTLLLAGMTGLNFFAYQAFVGWTTTFLKDVRAVGDADIGALVGWQFAGSVVGGFFWGWVGDRYGRRVAAAGFFTAAVLIVPFLYLPMGFAQLQLLALVIGASYASSVVWGPWLTELYPAHLRSTAASIFNWGRIISFMAPLVTAAIAERYGLTASMTLGSVAFTLAGIIWLQQPETLVRNDITTSKEAARA
ncbi:MAG: MFS transporter [Sandarakinorhabdus sp.]|nr:MFS transporter [Sandarakinorhabdus sp.]